MARNPKGEHYTHWAHVENGRPFSRRLHRIEVQANDGRLYTLTGDRLPAFLGTYTGTSNRGENVAEILVNPTRQSGLPILQDVPPWPSGRDVVNFVIGILSVMLLRFVVSVLGIG